MIAKILYDFFFFLMMTKIFDHYNKSFFYFVNCDISVYALLIYYRIAVIIFWYSLLFLCIYIACRFDHDIYIVIGCRNQAYNLLEKIIMKDDFDCLFKDYRGYLYFIAIMKWYKMEMNRKNVR